MIMKNIVLTGFMGTGKTAVGKELARLLDVPLIDIDTEIEKSERMSINDIFKQRGESGFREIETGMIKEISQREHSIISTGGGAVMKDENMKELRKSGIIICLMASPETILQRVGKSSERPLLQGENPSQKIKGLLHFRQPFYDKADIIIDTENRTPLQIAEEIAEYIRNRKC
jgi:shikimate kinase